MSTESDAFIESSKFGNPSSHDFMGSAAQDRGVAALFGSSFNLVTNWRFDNFDQAESAVVPPRDTVFTVMVDSWIPASPGPIFISTQGNFDFIHFVPPFDPAGGVYAWTGICSFKRVEQTNLIPGIWQLQLGANAGNTGTGFNADFFLEIFLGGSFTPVSLATFSPGSGFTGGEITNNHATSANGFNGWQAALTINTVAIGGGKVPTFLFFNFINASGTGNPGHIQCNTQFQGFLQIPA